MLLESRDCLVSPWGSLSRHCHLLGSLQLPRTFYQLAAQTDLLIFRVAVGCWPKPQEGDAVVSGDLAEGGECTGAGH